MYGRTAEVQSNYLWSNFNGNLKVFREWFMIVFKANQVSFSKWVLSRCQLSNVQQLLLLVFLKAMSLSQNRPITWSLLICQKQLRLQILITKIWVTKACPLNSIPLVGVMLEIQNRPGISASAFMVDDYFDMGAFQQSLEDITFSRCLCLINILFQMSFRMVVTLRNTQIPTTFSHWTPCSLIPTPIVLSFHDIQHHESVLLKNAVISIRSYFINSN